MLLIKINIKTFCLLAVCITLNACAAFPFFKTKSEGISSTQPVIERRYPANPDGSASTLWEEPMVDVVDVPPGLDPEGHYYRPSHQEVIEVRPGRWRYIETK
jgi:hypothetical protein